jgi:hypothetical protein
MVGLCSGEIVEGRDVDGFYGNIGHGS